MAFIPGTNSVGNWQPQIDALMKQIAAIQAPQQQMQQQTQQTPQQAPPSGGMGYNDLSINLSGGTHQGQHFLRPMGMVNPWLYGSRT